jgi:hypothetical protein
MIQVLARKALQFRNPNQVLVNKQAKLGENDQVNITTKLEEAFCRVPPNVVTLVPDWVKTDPIFEWCVADGTLMEVVVNPLSKGVGSKKIDPVTQQQVDLQAKGQQQAEVQQSEAEKAEKEKEKAALKEKLAKMSKQELIDYAFQEHDMELGPALTKADLLSAIEEAQKEKEAA